MMIETGDQRKHRKQATANLRVRTYNMGTQGRAALIVDAEIHGKQTKLVIGAEDGLGEAAAGLGGATAIEHKAERAAERAAEYFVYQKEDWEDAYALWWNRAKAFTTSARLVRDHGYDRVGGNRDDVKETLDLIDEKIAEAERTREIDEKIAKSVRSRNEEATA